MTKEPRRPKCMDDDEWRIWNEHETYTSAPVRQRSPCKSCPSSYAEEMRAIDMCDGEPLGDIDVDGEEVKAAPIPKKPKPKPIAPPTVRLSLIPTVPCHLCSEYDDCQMRSGVENITFMDVIVPAIKAPLGLNLTADITCHAFKAARRQKPRWHGQVTVDGQQP